MKVLQWNRAASRLDNGGIEQFKSTWIGVAICVQPERVTVVPVSDTQKCFACGGHDDVHPVAADRVDAGNDELAVDPPQWPVATNYTDAAGNLLVVGQAAKYPTGYYWVVRKLP